MTDPNDNSKQAGDFSQRQENRTPMKCQIKVSHPSIGEVVVSTRDISDSGVFLLTENITMPPVGAIVQGQVQGMGETAPILNMKIVRMEPAGVGLKFVT
jgi:hypothetical protein